jgi:hypothetical protein
MATGWVLQADRLKATKTANTNKGDFMAAF